LRVDPAIAPVISIRAIFFRNFLNGQIISRFLVG
jgi:hypothetical protein